MIIFYSNTYNDNDNDDNNNNNDDDRAWSFCGWITSSFVSSLLRPVSFLGRARRSGSSN